MPDPIDNQVVVDPGGGFSEEGNVGEVEPIVDPENSPAQEPIEQLSEIDQIIASLPEDKQQVIKDGFLRQDDYTKKRQSDSEKSKMVDKFLLDNKQKIEFYDNFVNDKELRKQMALQEGFVEPKGEKAINKKALELMEAMNPDERETIDYIVEQAIEKKLVHVNKFISEQATVKQRSRQEKINEIYSDFCSAHKDYEPNNEIDIAMRKESDALGLDFNTMPASRMKAALNTLYRSASSGRQIKTGKIAATKNIIKTNAVALKNSARSNSGASPNVNKSTSRYETLDDLFKDKFVQ